MSIPFIDLKSQFHHLESEIRAAIDIVLTHGKFIMGPEVSELEAKLADFAGVRHAISCSSGTDALLMPLMAWQIGEGDAVFVPPFTFVATAEVISMLGATPVFVDVDPQTFNLDPGKLQQSIDEVKNQGRLQPRGLIAVDLFGLPADYDSLNEIARRENLWLLEDAAQGFGGVYHNQPAGSLGDVGAVSFFPAKPLGAYGDGGAILTDDDETAERLRSVRVHGKGTDKYDNVRIGINGRLDTLQAAVLLAKLKSFSVELDARQHAAERYTANLKNVVQTPFVPDSLRSAWAQYSILTDSRSVIQEYLKSLGIPTMIYYPKPLHLQTAYSGLNHVPGDFPVSEALSERILSLPMHGYLEDTEIDAISSAIVTCLEDARAGIAS